MRYPKLNILIYRNWELILSQEGREWEGREWESIPHKGREFPPFPAFLAGNGKLWYLRVTGLFQKHIAGCVSGFSTVNPLPHASIDSYSRL